MRVERGPVRMPEDIHELRPLRGVVTPPANPEKPTTSHWTAMRQTEDPAEQEAIYRRIVDASIGNNPDASVQTKTDMLFDLTQSGLLPPEYTGAAPAPQKSENPTSVSENTTPPTFISEQAQQEQQFFENASQVHQALSETDEPAEKQRLLKELEQFLPKPDQDGQFDNRTPIAAAQEAPLNEPSIKSNGLDINPNGEGFDELIEKGEVAGMKIINVSVLPNGARMLKVKDDGTGHTFSILEGGSKEVVNLYYVRDPDPDPLSSPTGLDERGTEAGAKAWLDEALVTLERSNAPIDNSIETSVIQTISQFISNPPGYARPVPWSPGATESLQSELIRKARARIHVHNAAYNAKNSIKEYKASFAYLTFNPEETMEILLTPGVENAIKEMMANDGLYFRKFAPAGQVIPTKNSIIATLTPALGQEGATTAVDYAEKILHITGDSAYYDGIIDRNNNFIQPPPAVLNEGNDAITAWFADYFENHWDDINFVDAATDTAASVGGNGASALKQTFYYPVVLEQLGEDFGGEANFMKRYGYMWVTSLTKNLKRVTFPTDPATGNPKPITNILDLFYNNPAGGYKIFKDNQRTMRIAAGSLTEAAEVKEKLPGLLNDPLPDLNEVHSGNSAVGVKKCLDGMSKVTKEAYGFLGISGSRRATQHLLKGALRWVNSAEARGAPWYSIGWNAKIIHEAIIYAAGRGKMIDHTQLGHLKAAVNNSTTAAAFIGAIDPLPEGGWKIFQKWFGSILKN